jgi:hypothetical protein
VSLARCNHSSSEQHIARLAAAVHRLIGDGKWVPPAAVASNEAQGKRRRRRVLLIATGAMLLTLLAATGVYIAAVRRQAPVSNSVHHPGVSMDVSVINSGEEPIAEFFDTTQPARVRYRVESKGDTMEIIPTCDYLAAYESGGPIVALRGGFAGNSFFDAMPPQIDLKILNETNRTVVFARLLLHVHSSEPIQKPLVVLADDPPTPNTLRLLNEGWAGIKAATLKYRIDKVGTAGVSEAYPFIQSLPAFEDFTDIEIDRGSTPANESTVRPGHHNGRGTISASS